jgi:rare lipoprotein A (peptidoglycan hydrolase)
VTRPLGAAAALALAVVVSLFGTSLSVGRQPVPIESIDPDAFTVIVPVAPPGSAAPADAPVPPISDFRDEASLLSRVTTGVPLAPVHVVRSRPKPAAAATTAVASVGSGHRVGGLATWYCLPGVSACTSGHQGGLYAAAGSEIRIGNWRGRTVKVCGNGNCIYVKLIDWCACGGSRIIDLYHDAFSRLASPSRGGVAVTVSW